MSAVATNDAYANLLLPHRISAAGLHGSDAGFATELAYGTLRRRGYYDEVIALAADRPVDRIDPAVLDVLRLGAHQILGMRVAQHAAVNESVELVRDVASRGASGFANAVLRTLTRSTPEQWRDRVAARHPRELDRLAATTAHPAWIVRALRDALDAEGRAAELAEALDADNEAPLVSLVALPGLADAAEVESANLERMAPGRVSPIGLTLRRGDPHQLAEVAAGRVRVQDEGSQLVALALAAAPLEGGRDERWLDLCAGPGGKAALLASESVERGARLTANEVVPARAGLVRQALAPIGDGIEVVTGDGRAIGDDEPDAYDRILLDAPCTGLGALRRRPEARWRKAPDDVAELVDLQEALLHSALRAVRPGGVVAYSTCSPHLAETTAVVRRVMRSHDVEVLDARAVVERVSAAGAAVGERDAGERPALDLAERDFEGGTTVQLWPHRHGTDAMFLALLRRRS